MATGDMGFEGGITQFRQKYPATFQIGLENRQKNFGSPAIFRVPLPKDHAQPVHEEREVGHSA